MIYFVSACVIVSGIFNGFMDTLAFHYEGSFWEVIEKKKGWTYFRIYDDTVNGPGAWHNKNNFENKIVRAIMRGPLVFLTDGWHLFQFIFLTALQLPAAYLAAIELFSGEWYYVLAMLGVIKAIFGIAFELVFRR